MPSPGPLSFTLGLVAILSLLSSTIATTASNWTNPEARLPSFSSTYYVGERIYLSWQPLNQSTNDLWLTRYDISNNYTLRIATTLDIAHAGSFPWTIAVPEEEVEKDTRFIFVFVPSGSGYDAADDSELDSPAFNLMMVNQSTPPNGTVSATGPPTATSTTQSSPITSPTSTADSSSTSIPSSDNSDRVSNLSAGETAGIVIGVVAALILLCSVAASIIYKRRKSHHNQKVPADSEIPIKGPYEVLGSNKSATELNSKETQVHELISPQETLAHESDGTPVHEIGNTLKRPGLHEMPG